MKDPVLSIVVPAYNVEQYLERCVNSLISQTYRNIQIILVDDESTDKTGVICEELAQKDARVQVIHRKNGGLAAARNTGLELVKGEYVLFVDSDDWIAKDTARILLENAENEHSDMVCFDLIPVGPSGAFPRRFAVPRCFPELSKSDGNMCLEELYSRHINNYVWAFLYRTKFLQENHLTFDSKIRFLEDVLFTNQSLRCANVVTYVGNKPLYYYYVRPDSLTHSAGSAHVADGFAVLNRVLEMAQGETRGANFYDYMIDLFFFVELTTGNRRDLAVAQLRKELKTAILRLKKHVSYLSLSSTNKQKIVLLKLGCLNAARTFKHELDVLKTKIFQGKRGYGTDA